LLRRLRRTRLILGWCPGGHHVDTRWYEDPPGGWTFVPLTLQVNTLCVVMTCETMILYVHFLLFCSL
jgi:hypothetical protein